MRDVYARTVAVTAIIPLKALPAAKQRLSGVLAPENRHAVMVWMASRVIEACKTCTLLDDILVVAGDAAAADVGYNAGVRVVRVD